MKFLQIKTQICEAYHFSSAELIKRVESQAKSQLH